MDTGLEKKILESKRLNQSQIMVSSDLLSANIYWIKAVYSESESLLTQYTKHTFFEMQYALKGDILMTVGESDDIVCKQSQFIIIPPNTYHAITSSSETGAKFIMAFSLSSPDSKIQSLLQYLENPIPFNDNEELKNLIIMILNKAYDQTTLSDEIISRLVESFLLQILEIMIPKKVSRNTSAKMPVNDYRVHQITEYITKMSGIGITVSDIATKYNMSERHMNRIFKEVTGKTVKEIIDHEKLHKIEELISTTTLSLYEISEICGFMDEYAMNKFFRRHELMNLSDYRRFTK